MGMWKFKSCPRCGGDLFIERDLNGWYEQCLQCSYKRELKDLSKFSKHMVQKGKEPAEPLWTGK